MTISWTDADPNDYEGDEWLDAWENCNFDTRLVKQEFIRCAFDGFFNDEIINKTDGILFDIAKSVGYIPAYAFVAINQMYDGMIQINYNEGDNDDTILRLKFEF
jgi:hypothetical protein